MLLTDEISKSNGTTVADLVVNRVSTEAAFADLRDEWNRLAGDVPFQRWEWPESWWRYFSGSNDELCLLCVCNASGRLVGLAPWYIENSAMDGRVVRFLGSGRVCSDYLTIFAADGLSESVAKLIADWMADETDLSWDAIEFDGIAADDPTVVAFLEQLKTRNHTIHKTVGLSCWRIALPDCWESYLKCLSKSRRERVRQLHRHQFDTGRAVMHRAKSADEVRSGFKILVDLHQRRRESLGQPGCFSEPAFGDFLNEAALRFFNLGQLRLQ